MGGGTSGAGARGGDIGGIRLLRARSAGLCLLALLGGALGGCGEFGLPTDRGDGDLDRGEPTVLYIEPNLASQGTFGLTVRVFALDTFFDDTSDASLPNQPEIRILAVTPIGLETLDLTLDVPPETPLGSSPLVVETARDGALIFADGFTVVR